MGFKFTKTIMILSNEEIQNMLRKSKWSSLTVGQNP